MAALVGLANGLVTVYLRVPSLIVTLGMFNVLNGISLLISDGSQQTTPTGPHFGTIFGVGDYHTFYWAFGLMLVMHFVLTMTPWGLHTIAVGGNRIGASESGVNVNWIRIGNFVMCSILGGFAGILTAQHIGTTDPLQGGTDLMFYGVAGAVIGGTALMGGSGTVLGIVRRRGGADGAQQRLHADRRRRVLQRPLHRHRDPALDGARVRHRARRGGRRHERREPAAVAARRRARRRAARRAHRQELRRRSRRCATSACTCARARCSG